jgi:hypothetical protein
VLFEASWQQLCGGRWLASWWNLVVVNEFEGVRAFGLFVAVGKAAGLLVAQFFPEESFRASRRSSGYLMSWPVFVGMASCWVDDFKEVGVDV